jgi:hypothetical protein
MPTILRQNHKRKIPFLETLIGAVLGVAFWRGCWWALDTYFLPSNPVLSNVLCLVVPMLLAIVWALWAGYGFSWDVAPPVAIGGR